MNTIPFPTTVDLALTGRCNLKCKHCNTSGTWDLEQELSFEELKGVLDQFKAAKVFEINLFGGEPLSYPRIYEFLDLLDTYPIRVTILTNGTLIDDRMADRLAAMRFLSTIQVSIDGSRAEIHDWQRGEGAFEKAIRGIKLLKQRALPVTMKAVINSRNVDDIENMLKLALDLDMEGMDFGDAIECGRAAKYAGDMSLEANTHKRIMEEIFRLKVKYPDAVIGGTLGQKIGMLLEFFENGPGKGDRGNFNTCPAGQNMLSVRSDGKVVPCSALWTLICGDIKKDTLVDIWKNSTVLNEIRALADEDLRKYKDECVDCDYLTYCNGGCRAAAYYSCGEDLRGIELSNCFVFSNLYGGRVSKDFLKKMKDRVNG